MSTTLYMVRRGNSLAPISPADMQAFEGLPRARIIKVQVHIEASPKLIRLYWAFLAKLVQGGACGWPSADAADRDLLITLGYREAVVLRSDGDIHTVKFEPMSKREWGLPQWRTYLEQVYQHVAQEILPRQPSPRLQAEVERFAGVTFREAMEEEDVGSRRNIGAS